MAQQPINPARRIRIWIVVLIALVLAAVLAGAFLILGKRDMAVLAAHMRPAEAAAVAQALEAEGVAYEVADDGTTLLVSADQRDAVQLKIAGADIPIRGQQGFELFDSSELGLTEFAQRIKYQRALQGELARTIMKIDGITEARVHVSIPEKSVFRSERTPAKAAVTLLTRSREIETSDTIAGVQQLVAAAIPDLAPRDVVVLNAHGAMISSPVNQDGSSARIGDIETAIQTILPDTHVTARLTSVAIPAIANDEELEGEPPAAATSRHEILIITTSSPLDAKDRARIASLVLGAQVPGILSEQDMRFDVAPLSAAPTTAGPERTARRTPESKLVTPALPAVGATPIVATVAGLLLLAAIGALFWLRPKRQNLSLTDQRQFAERLREGLQAQSGEVPDAQV